MAATSYSVGELLGVVEAVLDEHLRSPVWVQGEIAGLRRGRNGHVYFDLVDRADDGRVEALLPVVLWASTRDLVNAHLRRVGSIRMDDGVRIRVSGSVDLYRARGTVQLQMNGIDPTYTLGLLAGERERVLRLLRAEGLLERNRALALPAVPARVGLVTAAGSAAEADFLRTLGESGFGWQVVHVDARVQGVGSEHDVAVALRTLARRGVDVIALVRGGGARTDLATFDTEVVARAIAGMAVPVLTGIGHETDRSVADEVAHRAHRTPTACAAALVESVAGSVRRLEAAWEAVRGAAEQRLSDVRDDLGHDARAVAHAARTRLAVEEHRGDVRRAELRRRAPLAVVGARARVEQVAGRADGGARAHLRGHEQALTGAARRLAVAAPRAARRASASLDATAARVAAVDPARALARGWSITRAADGTVVRRATDLRPGDELHTTLADGTVTSVVGPDHHPEDPDAP